jgi:integrase/recombinase XerD
MRAQMAAFLQFLRDEQHYADNTIMAYQSDLAQFVRFAEGWGTASDKQWSDVNVEMVDDYIDSLYRDAYAASTVVRKVATIKSILNYLQAPGGGRSSLAKKLAKLSLVKHQPKSLSRDEVERLLSMPCQRKPESARSLRDSALLNLLYATWMSATSPAARASGRYAGSLCLTIRSPSCGATWPRREAAWFGIPASARCSSTTVVKS